MKVYIDSNNKVIAYGGKALAKGEVPSVTFTVYDSRASIDSVTQTPINDISSRVDVELTILKDLSTSLTTLLTVNNPSGYTIRNVSGLYYLNNTTGSVYTIMFPGNNYIDFGSIAKSTGDKIHASFYVMMVENS